MASTVAMIGAGTIFKVGDGATPTEVFSAVPGCMAVGEIGSKGEFVESTPISSLTKEFISGLKTPPSIALLFNDLPGNAAQQAFFEQARDGETVNVQVVYPNGRTAALTLVLAGVVHSNPEPGKPLQATVHAQQTGDETHTIA